MSIILNCVFMRTSSIALTPSNTLIRVITEGKPHLTSVVVIDTNIPISNTPLQSQDTTIRYHSKQGLKDNTFQCRFEMLIVSDCAGS